MAFISLKIKIIIYFVVFQRKKKTTLFLKRVLIRGDSPTTRPTNPLWTEKSRRKIFNGLVGCQSKNSIIVLITTWILTLTITFVVVALLLAVFQPWVRIDIVNKSDKLAKSTR